MIPPKKKRSLQPPPNRSEFIGGARMTPELYHDNVTVMRNIPMDIWVLPDRANPHLVLAI